MKIGFDLDGIFIDKPPFIPKKLIDRLYGSYDHGLSYRFPSKPEQWIRNITHISLFRPAIWENIQKIKSTCTQNAHHYYLISSRFGFLKARTEYLLNKYELSGIFDNIYLNFNNEEPHIFKENILKKLRFDRYIDDDLPLLEFLAKHNPKIVFFWLNKKSNLRLLGNLITTTNLQAILK
ncbi:hypothetical protein A2892_04335 [Candidatus Woesebacteria bacterium RIFCSPLOWO2_01_FULL_39_10b]|uniref:Nucleotidase n=1 Tax=Candidatus Woesebacteria bacterium RIFCSPLOWO2_01_FULL_39_10b TaxID=1802517 RepID=A0A1F8B9X8_9BACT|nr:MAG: hypothetical protein A2892_04335 [Candidatus Woesebacteria bacterium RIFCSPLOWO2_01_FULL_39_10b]